MAVSQLKRLKAQAHEQRQARQKGRPTAAPAAAATKNGKPKKQLPKETAQQRSHALRAETLLPEFQRRHKVGGIIDRRIGENDPSLAPEKRAAQRYMAESQRQKKRSVFNLEDAEDDEDEGILTHGGRALGDGRRRSGTDTLGDILDDYEASEDDGGSSSDDGGDAATRRERKRKRFQELVDEALEQRELEPDRKKSKQEVMKEVIAKSKLHKYERQQAREDDDDIRAELDKGLPDLLAVLRGARGRPSAQQQSSQTDTLASGAVHPDRLAQMNNSSQQDTEKQYDQRIRQMAQEKRAQPTERTKTEEEKLKERADMLLALEADRQKRMRGELDSSDDEDNEDDSKRTDGTDMDPDLEREGTDEAREFGLGTSREVEKRGFNVEDEDDFVIDEDLVASGSEIEFDSDESSYEGNDRDETADEAADAEFLRDILPSKTADVATVGEATGKSLAYTYPCPQTHHDFLTVIKDVDASEVPTIIQRIRALYHAQLHSGNKEKLSKFAAVLVEHVAFMASGNAQVTVLESIIRHIHSLSKTYGHAVSKAFRLQLQKMHNTGTIDQSDIVILTAIGSIYPTSDHFHQVVTPAITITARWLCMSALSNPQTSLQGAFLVALALKYQSRSKRLIPETLRFTFAALKAVDSSTDAALVAQHLTNLKHMMDVWYDQVAFLDIFRPGVGEALALPAVSRACPELASSMSRTLKMMCSVKQLHRRPLELHHHRPLPIKTSIPKFEENFNPGAHYEPDREKAEAAKLRKEYKREKKGALRELRRDAEFLARQQLQDKKERDRAYEAKQRRIIGEIQREEGRERNEYEREKRRRKGRF